VQSSRQGAAAPARPAAGPGAAVSARPSASAWSAAGHPPCPVVPAALTGQNRQAPADSSGESDRCSFVSPQVLSTAPCNQVSPDISLLLENVFLAVIVHQIPDFTPAS